MPSAGRSGLRPDSSTRRERGGVRSLGQATAASATTTVPTGYVVSARRFRPDSLAASASRPIGRSERQPLAARRTTMEVAIPIVASRAAIGIPRTTNRRTECRTGSSATTAARSDSAGPTPRSFRALGVPRDRVLRFSSPRQDVAVGVPEGARCLGREGIDALHEQVCGLAGVDVAAAAGDVGAHEAWV